MSKVKEKQKTKLTSESFINKDGKFYIKDSFFAQIRKEYDREHLKSLMLKAIRDNNIELTCPQYTMPEAKDDFFELSRLDTRKLLKKEKNQFTRYPHKYAISEHYIEQTNVGNIASNVFQQANRMKCGAEGFESPNNVWKSDKKMLQVLNSFFTMDYGTLTEAKLFTALNMKHYIAAQFKPSVAKCVYELFNASSVLDISSGWGDRLAGFFAADCTTSYVGFDPNESLYRQYNEQIKFYSQFKKKAAIINCLPFEKTKFVSQFDLVFTSPPYFKKEKYSEHEGQSFKNFTTFDDWMNHFMFKTIDISMRSLSKDGFLAINIEDVNTGKTVNEICDAMCDYIIKKHKAKYVGCLGMKMSKRPNSKSDRVGTFIEPIWIFSRNKVTIDDIIKKRLSPKTQLFD